ncbi:hypothetical protein IWZ03DRAFT_24786 [Phyllosticta citriasiana]|uniref:Uncharacterized protein n=1 Tax=Phyllosticta citriasiana TaxID=595635 RepID=A0ABR1L021_9PEZI
MKCSSYSRSPSSRSLATNMAWCLNQGVERGTWDPKNCENCKTFLSKKTVAWCPLDPTQMWCIPDTPAANLPRSSLRRNSRIQTIVATMTSATKSSQQMSARERTSGKISKAKTLAFSAQDAIREPLPLIEDETKPASTCVIGVTEMTYHQGNLARTRQYQSASTAISAMHEFKQQQFAFPNSLVPFFSTSGFSAADWHHVPSTGEAMIYSGVRFFSASILGGCAWYRKRVQRRRPKMKRMLQLREKTRLLSVKRLERPGI